MNGVLVEGATIPEQNWGDYPDAGYDLTGATGISFWAKGEIGGEQIKFSQKLPPNEIFIEKILLVAATEANNIICMIFYIFSCISCINN